MMQAAAGAVLLSGCALGLTEKAKRVMTLAAARAREKASPRKPKWSTTNSPVRRGMSAPCCEPTLTGTPDAESRSERP